MIFGFELTLFLYVMLAALFRLLWGFSQPLALITLAVCNTVLLGLANPLLLWFVSVQIGFVLGLYFIGVRFPSIAKHISWLAFLGLIPFNLQLWFGDAIASSGLLVPLQGGPDPLIVWTAGTLFVVIKSFVALREAILAKGFRFLPTLAGLTFVPSFPAGPIFGSKPFMSTAIPDKLDFREIAVSVMKLGWGAAALYVIAPALRDVAAQTPEAGWGTVADIYLMFGALFFDFSGYTLIAISVAAFFGVTLPENFNRPYLATSIREFWQRWHMSISAFVGTYLFKPFVRETGLPRTGIFLAFVAVGLWHEFTLTYLLWGIGHGAALSLAMKPPKTWRQAMSRLPPWLHKLIGWALTMTWVALLSHIANGLFWSVR